MAKKRTTEFRRKMSKLAKKRWKDPEFVAGQKRIRNSKEWREAHSISLKARWATREGRGKLLKGIRSPEVSKKKSISLKKVWPSYTKAERLARRALLTRAANRPDTRRKKIEGILKSVQAKPNTKEQKLNRILKKYFPGEFKLNVKGQVVVAGKVPDFVNVNGRKLLVEHFGTYWHGESVQGISAKAEEANRKKLFARWGFKTVVVWEDELKNEAQVVSKVRRAL